MFLLDHFVFISLAILCFSFTVVLSFFFSKWMDIQLKERYGITFDIAIINPELQSIEIHLQM